MRDTVRSLTSPLTVRSLAPAGRSLHGGGPGERNVSGPPSSGFGFPVCLLWSRSAERHGVESPRSSQRTFLHAKAPCVCSCLHVIQQVPLRLFQLSEFRHKMQSLFPTVPKNSEEACEPLDWDSVFKSK